MKIFIIFLRNKYFPKNKDMQLNMVGTLGITDIHEYSQLLGKKYFPNGHKTVKTGMKYFPKPRDISIGRFWEIFFSLPYRCTYAR
jgi:hypothetical protein